MQHLLGRIASLIRVPREKDFGIDFYLQPRARAGAHTETVGELASVQVKGGQAELGYGGVDQHGVWREHEFAWLRSLGTPLMLARVDAACAVVELFSIWPLWLIFWRQSAVPFEVVFSTEPATTVSCAFREPESETTHDAAGRGDGLRWTVHLGPPMLRLTSEALNETDFRAQALAAITAQISVDRLILTRFQQFVPVLVGVTAWRTSPPELVGYTQWQFWDQTPGANISRLCQTASPILMNLGAHLQWQNDSAAYNLIPVLQWLEAQGQLDAMGRGLLSGLIDTHARGIGPRAPGETDTRHNSDVAADEALGRCAPSGPRS